MSITTFTLWILCQCFLLFAWKACLKTDQTYHWISEGQMSLNSPFSFKLFFETNVHSSVFCSAELLYHFVSLDPLPMVIFVIDLPYKCWCWCQRDLQQAPSLPLPSVFVNVCVRDIEFFLFSKHLLSLCHTHTHFFFLVNIASASVFVSIYSRSLWQWYVDFMFSEKSRMIYF